MFLPSFFEVAHADIQVTPAGNITAAVNSTTAPHLISVGINTAITYLTLIATILAVFYLIYAGIRYITAAGDPAKIKTARAGILQAITGIIIVVCTFFIIKIAVSVGNTLVNPSAAITSTSSSGGSSGSGSGSSSTGDSKSGSTEAGTANFFNCYNNPTAQGCPCYYSTSYSYGTTADNAMDCLTTDPTTATDGTGTPTITLGDGVNDGVDDSGNPCIHLADPLHCHVFTGTLGDALNNGTTPEGKPCNTVVDPFCIENTNTTNKPPIIDTTTSTAPPAPDYLVHFCDNHQVVGWKDDIGCGSNAPGYAAYCATSTGAADSACTGLWIEACQTWPNLQACLGGNAPTTPTTTTTTTSTPPDWLAHWCDNGINDAIACGSNAPGYIRYCSDSTHTDYASVCTTLGSNWGTICQQYPTVSACVGSSTYTDQPVKADTSSSEDITITTKHFASTVTFIYDDGTSISQSKRSGIDHQIASIMATTANSIPHLGKSPVAYVAILPGNAANEACGNSDAAYRIDGCYGSNYGYYTGIPNDAKVLFLNDSEFGNTTNLNLTVSHEILHSFVPASSATGFSKAYEEMLVEYFARKTFGQPPAEDAAYQDLEDVVPKLEKVLTAAGVQNPDDYLADALFNSGLKKVDALINPYLTNPPFLNNLAEFLSTQDGKTDQKAVDSYVASVISKVKK